MCEVTHPDASGWGFVNIAWCACACGNNALTERTGKTVIKKNIGLGLVHYVISPSTIFDSILLVYTTYLQLGTAGTSSKPVKGSGPQSDTLP